MAGPDSCPRCHAAFLCGANGSAPCACTTVPLSAALQTQLRQQYSGCLCLSCLRDLSAAEAADPPRHAGATQPP